MTAIRLEIQGAILSCGDADAGKCDDVLSSAEREELRKLRRENKRLKLEREIPAKAMAWFAQETNSIPDKDSNS